MVTENGISEGGEVRRLKDGKIFSDVHVSANGRISGTEKISSDLVRRISEAPPEVINFADPADFEPWDPENTNPQMPVVQPVLIGDLVAYASTIAKVTAFEGEKAKLDIGVSVPLGQVQRVDAYAAVAAMRRRIENLVEDVRVLEARAETLEETAAKAQAQVARLEGHVKERELQLAGLESRNNELTERVKLLEAVKTLQQEKLVEVANMGMRVYSLVYDPISEQDKADEFMNLHLGFGAKHWTDQALPNGKFIIRIASRKPSEKIVELPKAADKAEEAGKGEASA